MFTAKMLFRFNQVVRLITMSCQSARETWLDAILLGVHRSYLVTMRCMKSGRGFIQCQRQCCVVVEYNDYNAMRTWINTMSVVPLCRCLATHSSAYTVDRC